MLKKISLMRMDARLSPAKNRPAALAGDASHSANRVDDPRMPDQFQDRKVTGAVSVHVAGAQIISLLRREVLRHHALAMAVGIRIEHGAGIQRAVPFKPAGGHLLDFEKGCQGLDQKIGRTGQKHNIMVLSLMLFDNATRVFRNTRADGFPEKCPRL